MWKKIKIRYKLAISIAIVALILSIVNLFVKNETLKIILQFTPILVLGLDCWCFIEDNQKMLERMTKQNYELHQTRYALHNLRFQINRMNDDHIFVKKEIVEAITKAIDEAEKDVKE